MRRTPIARPTSAAESQGRQMSIIRLVVPGPNVAFRLRFNGKIDRKRSKLTLLGSDGTEKTLSILGGTSSDVLTCKANGLKDRCFGLRWQVRASGGRITRGQVQFRVGQTH